MTEFQVDQVEVKESSGYEMPPEGTHQAVCADVVNLGKVETKFGVKDQVALVFQLECEGGFRRTDGERFEISRRFSPTLTGSSSLKKFLEQWRGKAFTKEELQGFQLAKLHKINATLQVLHKDGERGPYASIASIVPFNPKLGAAITPENYKRRIKRDEPETVETHAPEGDTSPVPF